MYHVEKLLPDNILFKPNGDLRLHYIWDVDSPGFGYFIPLDDNYILNKESEEELSESELSIKLFSRIHALKPCDECEYFDVKSLWKEYVSQYIDDGILVSPKWDGWRLHLHIDKTKNKVALYTEDEYLDVSKNMPSIVKEILRVFKGENAIFDGEFVWYNENEIINPKATKVWLKYRQYPREELPSFRKTPPPSDKYTAYHIYDMLYYNGEDLTQLPYTERMEYVRKAIGRDYDYIDISENWLAKDKRSLERLVHKARTFPNSEGAMIKVPDHKYKLKGRTRGLVKLKNYKEYEAMIVGIHKVKDQPGVYNYRVALGPIPKEWLPKLVEDRIYEYKGKKYYILSQTYNIKQKLNIGDIIEVRTIRIAKFTRDDKIYFTHMFPSFIRHRPEKKEPDPFSHILKIEKVGTGLLMKSLYDKIDTSMTYNNIIEIVRDNVITVKLKPCPHLTDGILCPWREKFYIPSIVEEYIKKQKSLEKVEIEYLKYPIRCLWANIYKCRLIKEYYYNYFVGELEMKDDKKQNDEEKDNDKELTGTCCK